MDSHIEFAGETYLDSLDAARLIAQQGRAQAQAYLDNAVTESQRLNRLRTITEQATAILLRYRHDRVVEANIPSLVTALWSHFQRTGRSSYLPCA